MDLPKHAFFKGKIVPYSEAKVGVLTHALNYGTAAFGGIRAYWNESEQQLFIFRPFEHYQRLLNSAKLLMMELEYTPKSLSELTIQLLQIEDYHCDVYLRPLVYKADEIIGVKLNGLQDEISIVAVPFDRYVGNDTNAHVTFSSWRRIDDNIIPARGKISGAYANSSFIKTDAARADDARFGVEGGHPADGETVSRVPVGHAPGVTDDAGQRGHRGCLFEDALVHGGDQPFVGDDAGAHAHARAMRGRQLPEGFRHLADVFRHGHG